MVSHCKYTESDWTRNKKAYRVQEKIHNSKHEWNVKIGFDILLLKLIYILIEFPFA